MVSLSASCSSSSCPPLSSPGLPPSRPPRTCRSLHKRREKTTRVRRRGWWPSPTPDWPRCLSLRSPREEGEGPAGRIAGTTGSGCSESGARIWTVPTRTTLTMVYSPALLLHSPSLSLSLPVSHMTVFKSRLGN